MKVRCWGARGSIPVSGPQFVRYGGDTACVEVRSKAGDILVLDAGTGIRPLGVELAREGRSDVALLLTHFHWDHVQGLPFFKPLFDPAARLALGGGCGGQAELLAVLSGALKPPLFPVALDDAPAAISALEFVDDTLRVGALTVRRIPLSHPDRAAGFRVEEDGASLVYLTDNELSLRHPGGLGFADYAAFARGADLLIHDAEYTPEEYPERRGWGHSHILEAALLAREAGARRLGLFHHNQERTDDALDALAARCGGLLSEPGDPQCLALAQDFRLDLG